MVATGGSTVLNYKILVSGLVIDPSTVLIITAYQLTLGAYGDTLQIPWKSTR